MKTPHPNKVYMLCQKSLIFTSLLVCAGCLLLLACIKKSSDLTTKTKQFVYCSEGVPSSFNPQIAMDGTTSNATHPLYNTLVSFEYGTTHIIPSLATHWEVDSKGLIYTFHLRRDVSFHTTKYFTPTRNLNADDVLFSFQRQMDPRHPYHKVNGGTYMYFHAMGMRKIIKSIQKINDHQIKFTLTQPETPFLANLAMDFTSILSKEYADQLLQAGTPEKLDHQPIGTGPFVFVDYKRDTLIHFKAFADYFDKRGNIQTLTFAITPDANVRLQKLKSNECQFIAYPAIEDLKAIQADKNLKLMEAPGFNVGYLAMNVKKKPFENKLVRQALNHALNRKAYIQAIYHQKAELAETPLPPQMWGTHPHIKGYDYDPQKTKNLLKQAGFAKGFQTELWTLPVTRPYMPAGKKLGEMMQEDLAKVGVNVHLLSYDWPTYLDKAGRGEHSLLQIGWRTDNGDPDNFLFTLLSCQAIKGSSNLASWCYQPYNQLVVKAKKSRNHKERMRLYQEAQEIFKEEAPWVPIAHAKAYRGMRQNISGYKIHPTDRDIFTFIEIK